MPARRRRAQPPLRHRPGYRQLGLCHPQQQETPGIDSNWTADPLVAGSTNSRYSGLVNILEKPVSRGENGGELRFWKSYKESSTMLGKSRHGSSVKPFRGIALTMAGVSIAVFGLSISIIGQTIAQVGSTNFGPGVFLGALVAAIGAVISLISALVLEES